MNLKIDFFSQYLEWQRLCTSLLLEILEATTRIGIHRRRFFGSSLWRQSHLQKLQETFFGGVTS